MVSCSPANTAKHYRNPVSAVKPGFCTLKQLYIGERRRYHTYSGLLDQRSLSQSKISRLTTSGFSS